MSVSFTVIIPVFNGAAYLKQTLESVLRQTLAPLEILVIDDGSTDESSNIAQSFSPKVTVIRRANSGVSATRNFGVSIANSNWIAFMDADDLWEPEYLEAHAEVITSASGLDLCYSDRLHLVQQENGEFEIRERYRVSPQSQFRRAVLERSLFGPSCFTIRRSTFLAIGGFESRFDAVEDWHLCLRLLQANAAFAHIPHPLVQYRVHAASITNNPLPVLKKTIALVNEQIIPHLSRFERLTQGRRTLSRLTAEAAILLRENGKPGTKWMLRSIALHPFHEPRRYKVAAHMLLPQKLWAARKKSAALVQLPKQGRYGS